MVPSLRRSRSQIVLVTATLWLLGLGQGTAADAASIARGREIATQIGCAQCHRELTPNPALRELAPDLGSAGLRYQSAWLFEFLRTPTRIRQHLGAARMPDFGLTPREALALTAYLEAQRHDEGEWPPTPPGLESPPGATPVSEAEFRSELGRGLLCLTCHDYAGSGGHRAVELTNLSVRVRPEWVRQYLVSPSRFGVPASVMPAQFYQVTEAHAGFRELIPGAARRIQRLTSHLFSLNAERRTQLAERLAQARQRQPDVSPAQGEALFRALNCAACHRHPVVQPRTNAAPSLAGEGLRVRRPWLERFLAHPSAIRPFGYQPGDGSRMPDFHLTADETGDLSAFLEAQQTAPPNLATGYHPQPRSAFALHKASLLLRDKLSCLGCHSLDGIGGRIAPDLGHARERLQPAYVWNVIRDPHSITPQSIMPKMSWPEDTAKLLTDYLLQRDSTARESIYLSPLDHRTINPATGNRAARNYARHCAACHGADGKGDGFNAAFLPVKPTDHTDASTLGRRPDDTLFDGIHAGGAVLNKSHLMPAWGNLLSTEEIRELVAFLRSLCHCHGPEWARDGGH